MAEIGNMRGGRGGIPWRLIGWGGAACLLLLPLVANAPWTASDYVFAAVMFGLVGGLLELIVRASSNVFYRAGVGAAVLASFLLVWVNGAVGFLGDEDNPANLMFLGVILVAVLGSAFAGFRAAGMSKAMFVAAAAQVLVAVGGLLAGYAAPGDQGIYEVVLGTSLFAPLWLIAGALLRKAASDERTLQR